MDILFTALGVILVLAVWPALVLYAWNDSMLRKPHRSRRPRRAEPRESGLVLTRASHTS